MAAQVRARAIVVQDDFLCNRPLVLRDVGPWDRFPTVTNDAEGVVLHYFNAGKLPEGRRLLYYDSEGQLTELKHEAGVFKGFAPATEADGLG